MVFRTKKYYIDGFTVLIVLLLAGFTDTYSKQPKRGFWDMEGTLVTHLFEDQSDSLSGPELLELQNENGVPIWFGRHFYKDVCMTGECKMIRLSLFWDGAGNYLGMNIPEGEPLTKSDHTEFDASDYEKLQKILKDTTSILKELESEELIIVPDSIDPFKAYEVDGYTAATRPGLTEVVVKDAVYTCHTLWHTVYGPTQERILNLLDERIDVEFLTQMIESRETSKQIWGIQAVEKYPKYHDNFYPLFIEWIRSDDSLLSERSLQYFEPSKLGNETLQKQIAGVIPFISSQSKNEIIWKFIEHGNVDEDVVLELLNLFLEQKISIGSLNLVYRLILPEHLNNHQILEVIGTLLENQDAYVRNLTRNVFNDMSVD